MGHITSLHRGRTRAFKAFCQECSLAGALGSWSQPLRLSSLGPLIVLKCHDYQHNYPTLTRTPKVLYLISVFLLLPFSSVLHNSLPCLYRTLLPTPTALKSRPLPCSPHSARAPLVSWPRESQAHEQDSEKTGNPLSAAARANPLTSTRQHLQPNGTRRAPRNRGKTGRAKEQWDLASHLPSHQEYHRLGSPATWALV